MEWVNELEKTIDYIEKHLLKDIKIESISKNVGISSFYLQKSFQIITGYSISEYIRNRRLFLAARELSNSKKKIIDIAYKYKYETPESFTKAFTRFHNNTPSVVKKGGNYNSFYRIKIKISIEQGEEMKVNITPKFPMKFIGFEKEFEFDNSYEMIPKYWDEICEKYCKRIYAGEKPVTAEEKAIVDNCIGEYAICLDGNNKKFKYLIAGRYTGGEVPKGMKLIELEQGDWAVFDCIGPNPKTLQSVNTQVFNEWLPNNGEYKIRANYNIEWYDCSADMNDPDYHSAIWVPVTKK